MKSDLHLHSYHSSDSDTPSEEMILRGIQLGLKTMCFTEHFDMDFPKEIGDFSLDTPKYLQEFLTLKDKYAGQIELLFGVELGMLDQLGERYEVYTSSFPFDYVIASQHLLWNADPYYPEFWENRDPQAIIHAYFSETLKNLKDMKSFDTLGHLDYIVRYSGSERDHYSYARYSDSIDEILRYLIQEGKALEINTAGLKYGLGHPNPSEDILMRYAELGGELITVGSDGHKPEHLAYDFPIIPQMLRSFGFRYHFIYRERKPYPVSL